MRVKRPMRTIAPVRRRVKSHTETFYKNFFKNERFVNFTIVHLQIFYYHKKDFVKNISNKHPDKL